jgi:NTP pyrophosphatase (non-canonical NTP hydrolase)
VLISTYADFVGRTDLAKDSPDSRFDIAVYGLVGEIGSLVAAIKKRLLAAGRRDWAVPNDEIIEELGDSLWYCFAVAAACDVGDTFLASDIEALRVEVGGAGERAERIRGVLGTRADEFLDRSPAFLASAAIGTATLEDYRDLAFLTSRTKADQLVEVSLAVLQQLTAELLRRKLPALERELNTSLVDRPVKTVLGETIWHMAALASLYGLDFGKVAELNITKLNRRFGRGEPTPLPDEGRPANETLPRRFEVGFVAVGPGRSRMYMDGRRLGDDLTDNAYQEDGYRFHDVMHLALVAKLGWSPVLRKLMGKKRKSDSKLDEVEDGARAQIVEEAVIKAIHAEGERVAALAPGGAGGAPQLFANSADISFAFLKRLSFLVSGLEAERNRYWEWEDAILEGFRIFGDLRRSGRGTVKIDLTDRSITFSSEVFIDLAGAVAAVGAASCSDSGPGGNSIAQRPGSASAVSPQTMAACRRAIETALGLEGAADEDLVVVGWRDGVVDVKAAGPVQRAIWDRGVISFKTTVVERVDSVDVTVLGISDD